MFEYFKSAKIFLQSQEFNPWKKKGNSNGGNPFDRLAKIMRSEEWGGMNNGNDGSGFSLSYYLFPIAAIVIFLYLVGGFYIVQPDSKGVELKFGKYSRSTEPGLHYNYPRPFGISYVVPVKKINIESIGISENYEKEDNRRLVLTSDENILLIGFQIQWHIENAYEYLFNFRDEDVEGSIRNIAESAMREEIGKNEMLFSITGNGRKAISEAVRSTMQEIADRYGMGVIIDSIQLRQIDPPQKVLDAFRDVQSARSDKERFVNEAMLYSNSLIPKAKGEAAQLLRGAEAYASEVVNGALGDVSRFRSMYEVYQKAPDLTKERIYVDTIANIMRSAEVTIMGEQQNNILSHLSLNSSKSELGSDK